ncbi:hypothetical protein [Methanohalophilus sp. WG1-DM]|jgi:hypothetical protein|uniref:hypothetical protein n=1 Tax=Methanohalophilus sp. WG1-DM TaxID=2491675 RepID=UPI000FFE858D|nr:hypothetical protein [Methanohalophilus sp. WG1-DM]RXG34336.1 hypothetical protein CI957_1022 [Methanohalophilus sp. WG1-DM]
MIILEKWYKNQIEKIDDTGLKGVELNTMMDRKVCCGKKATKRKRLGYIHSPADIELTNVREYNIEEGTLKVWIQL